MKMLDFMSPLHKSTKRDYLKRVNDTEFPKHKAASLAKKFDYDYSVIDLIFLKGPESGYFIRNFKEKN